MSGAENLEKTDETRTPAPKSRKRKPVRRNRPWMLLLGIGGVALMVADALLLVLIARKQDEAETLIADNETKGTVVSELQADLVELENFKYMLYGQGSATRERLSELNVVKETSLAQVFGIRDALIEMIECHDSQLDLIAFQWTSKINTGGLDRETAVKAQCSEAKRLFDSLKAGIDE